MPLKWEETLLENEQLRAQAQARPSSDPQAQEHITRLLAMNEGLAAQLREALMQVAELKRELFGPKADKLTPEQEAVLAQVQEEMTEEAEREAPASQDVLEPEQEEEAKDASEKAPQKGGGRHPLPEHLERQTVVLEPENLPACGDCGQPLECIGEETTEELDYVPAKVVVRRLVRHKYGCRCGGGGVHIAPLPPRLVPQSKLGLALAVYLLLGRYDDHVTYYTMERIFRERHGVVIPRQQMVQWVAQGAALLQPLWLLMFEEMKKGGYLQIDETPVKVLDPEVKGKAATGFLWFYAVPGADVWLEFQDTRGKKAPHAKLGDFTGTIQTDAYAVYESLLKDIPGLRRIGCAAHARRRFYKAVREGDVEAVWFMGQFRQLYKIERQAKNLGPPARREFRLRQAPPIWRAMKQRALALQGKTLPQSGLGKALSYFINEYQALVGYLKNGLFELDNNLIENSIRGPVIGKKRWLFIGHPDAGWRSAVIYSLIISCRRRGINPQEYLTDVLGRLPAMNITQIGELLPARWQPTLGSQKD
jgi:transposase